METLYTYTVRKNGYILFSSNPMPEEQAVLEAAQYPEVDVEECEGDCDYADRPDHQL
jgi:hypothetical protein|tara:strand:+ start:529 stop:699 length:171 start_codon:yes stop_codon:yes gene_type:complete